MRRLGMAAAASTDEEFIELFEQHGAVETANRLKVSVRSVHKRRRNIEHKVARSLLSPNRSLNQKFARGSEHSHRIVLRISDGIVLVGSDAHYWPGPPSLMHRAFVAFIKKLKPAAVILNGDVMDCASISRHAPIGWEARPRVIEEIETAQDRTDEIVKVCPRGCRKIWTLGNHDQRFETRLATVAPEFAMIHGVHLHDHFPLWETCWSTFVNDDVVIKHRFKGGIHATHNNVLWSGRTTVTGHLHSAKVAPFTDYNGERYGVDTGCLADVDDKAFVDYTEDNPKNWRAAFGVLTFIGGKLLCPELVTKWDKNRVQFRGALIEV